MGQLLRLLLVCLAFGTVQAALAGPLEDGLAAYDKEDYPAAMKLLRPLAERGDATAQALVGNMYYNARGVPQDYKEAARWYRAAADQGRASQQFLLGTLYQDGQGVIQDDEEAVRWYRKAADQGYAPAQSSLASAYLFGEGVKEDVKEASRLYRLAAAQGNLVAAYTLGVISQGSFGVPQNDKEAAEWFRRAAEQGHAASQMKLAAIYSQGRGIARDLVQSHKWYNLAAARFPASRSEDRDTAARGRDEVAGKMTQAQVAEAQKLAREWTPGKVDVPAPAPAAVKKEATVAAASPPPLRSAAPPVAEWRQRSAALSAAERQKASGYFRTGFSNLETKDGARAVEAFAAGLALDPGNGSARYYHGEALRLAGRTGEAIPHWQAARELAPGTREAQLAGERLRENTR